MTLRLLTTAIAFTRQKFIGEKFYHVKTNYCGKQNFLINPSIRRCATTSSVQIVNRYSFENIGQFIPKSQTSYKNALYVCGAILGILTLKTLIYYKNNPGRNKLRLLNILICVVLVGSYFASLYALKKWNICISLCVVIAAYCANSIAHEVVYLPKKRAYSYTHQSPYSLLILSLYSLIAFLPLFGILSPRILKYFTANLFTSIIATSATVICAENNADFRLACPVVVGSALLGTNMYLARSLPFSIVSLEFLVISALIIHMCGQYKRYNMRYGENFDKHPNGILSYSTMYLYLLINTNLWCLMQSIYMRYADLSPKNVPFTAYYAIDRKKYTPEIHTTMEEDKETIFYNYRKYID